MNTAYRDQPLYKLGVIQSDLYLFEKLFRKSAVHDRKIMIGYVFIDPTDSFDADAMEKAYFELLRRNDAFRMRVVHPFGFARQYFQDVSSYTAPVRKKMAGGIPALLDYCKKPDIPRMSIADHQLTQAEIYTCDDGSGGMVIWQHHICSDGYSMGKIAYPQVCDFYDCYKSGQEPPEPQKIFSFAEYLTAEQKINKQRWKKDFIWCWKEYNRNFFHYSIPMKFHPGWKNEDIRLFEIKGNQYKAFADLCSQKHLSSSAVLMSAAAVVVKSETGAKRFLFNSESHGRTTYAQKHTAGAMLNELPIFFELIKPISVGDFLQNTYRKSIDATIHMRFNGVYRQTVFCSLLKLFRVGFFKNYRWMSFNNMQDYHEDESHSLDFMMLDQQPNTGFVIQIMNLDKEDGIQVLFFYDSRFIADDRIDIFRKKFSRAIDFFCGHPDEMINDCLEYIKE